MEETYQAELVQLLIASSTGQSTPRDQILKNKVLAIIREGELPTLEALRKQLEKNEQLKNQPQPTDNTLSLPLNQVTITSQQQQQQQLQLQQQQLQQQQLQQQQ